MSGKGKRGKGGKSGKQVSRSQRAGLQFPGGRLARYLKEGGYASRVGGAAPGKQLKANDEGGSDDVDTEDG